MLVAMLGQAAPCGGLPAGVECGMLGRLSRSVAVSAACCAATPYCMGVWEGCAYEPALIRAALTDNPYIYHCRMAGNPVCESLGRTHCVRE